MGFFRQEDWSGLPCLPPGDRPDPGIKTMSPVSPALQVDSLPNEPLGKLLLFDCLSNLLLSSFYKDTGDGTQDLPE